MSAVQQPRRWQSRDPGAQGSRQQRIARINPQVWTRMICGPRLGTFCREPPPPPRGLHCHPGTASQRPDACSQKPASSPGVDLKGPRTSCSPTGLNICLQLTKKAGGAREAAEKGGRASGCQVCTHLSVNLEDNSRAGQVGRRE